MYKTQVSILVYACIWALNTDLQGPTADSSDSEHSNRAKGDPGRGERERDGEVIAPDKRLDHVDEMMPRRG